MPRARLNLNNDDVDLVANGAVENAVGSAKAECKGSARFVTMSTF
jgi:hypothetical protein